MREPLSIDAARGFAYAPLGQELRRDLALWITAGEVPGSEVVRAGRLFRTGELAIKFFGRRSTWPLRDLLPVSPAIRFAELAHSITAVATPEVLVALDLRQGGVRRRSLVAYRWVKGESLERLWASAPEAVAAFPRFLAAMHAARVFHGDFHLHQTLWDGEGWTLIDLDGLRHPLRTLPVRRLAVEHWAQVLFGLEFFLGVAALEEARGSFEAYTGACSILGAEDFDAVVRRSRELSKGRIQP